ncbi:MFS transporter [Natranaerobius thermophilus]|uniref:Major facilitator superfamily MFS_1 n=1 Tax=Natranaerobius thermophilus (strain ATCC BAA-1301 / DSM 18059 / JW/NM-WN-LF) TaxID=457570 RepID=B2A844_NATTJ|nr:MFS transporter [Natranaerobius thermophilus]ACB85812.1 major facilitator superfamily MFS_1 [Natranaerobius thermophilus JW/NM-WN-LF]
MQQRTKIFILMVISMVLGYLPWYNFSAVMNYIAKDFNLSSDQTGMILSAFQMGYVIVVILSGWIADKVGDKKVVAWATLSTAVFSTAFTFFSSGFWSILVLRLLTGLSAGAIYVPGMALLSKWFPPKERGKVIGGYTGAMTLAYAGGYFIAGPLASNFGWQVGILFTSLPAFIAAYIVFFMVHEPEESTYEESTKQDAEESESSYSNTDVKPAPEGGYVGPSVITAGYMGHMWELYAFWGWIGPFMTASAFKVGYSSAEAVSLGNFLAALIIVSGAPAVYVMGKIADKWGRSKTIFMCSIFSLVAQLFLGFLHGHSLVFVTLVGFWIGFWVVADSGIYKAGLTEMVNFRLRSTMLGIQSAAGYLMTVVSPYVFGVVLDLQNNGADPMHAENWSLPFIILGLGAILAPISAIIIRKTRQGSLMVNGKY